MEIMILYNPCKAISVKNNGETSMKINLVILFLVFSIPGIMSCAQEERRNNKQPLLSETAKQSAVTNRDENPENMISNSEKSAKKRKYKFPSMMVKNDMRHCEKEGDYSCTPLLSNLLVSGWEVSGDKYGRNFISTSPEITYRELVEYLHFNDSDVTYVSNPKLGEPQARIQTEWLTCNITFLNKIYDGKDKEVKLKAVLIDNEVKANSERETEYDKNKGLIRKVLDFFKVVHSP